MIVAAGVWLESKNCERPRIEGWELLGWLLPELDGELLSFSFALTRNLFEREEPLSSSIWIGRRLRGELNVSSAGRLYLKFLRITKLN